MRLKQDISPEVKNKLLYLHLEPLHHQELDIIIGEPLWHLNATRITLKQAAASHLLGALYDCQFKRSQEEERALQWVLSAEQTVLPHEFYDPDDSMCRDCMWQRYYLELLTNPKGKSWYRFFFCQQRFPFEKQFFSLVCGLNTHLTTGWTRCYLI